MYKALIYALLKYNVSCKYFIHGRSTVVSVLFKHQSLKMCEAVDVQSLYSRPHC